MTVQPFDRLTAIAMPLVRDNIDTDAIIPSREMTSVSKTGLAGGLFAGWRFTEIGGRDPDPAFVMNDPLYADAQILLAGRNFGCGSSREHAVWALAEYGFRAIIAPSFNPIFRGNCIRNGIVPVELAPEAIAQIGTANPVTVDLIAFTVGLPDSRFWPFALEAESREMLVEGLDAIELTAKRSAEIAAFRDADARQRPWIYL